MSSNEATVVATVAFSRLPDGHIVADVQGHWNPADLADNLRWVAGHIDAHGLVGNERDCDCGKDH